MTEIEHFEALKTKVLLKYQEHFPFFQGNWKRFSSQDIQNLIGLIEEQCKQSISEKWIYTHLKPETVQKLPRKDMLQILSQFVGYSSWDEWVFEHSQTLPVIEVKQSNTKKWWFFGVGIVVILGSLFVVKMNSLPPQTIQFKNEYTKEPITDEVKVVQVTDSSKENVPVVGGKAAVQQTGARLIIKSPFYKTKTIHLASDTSNSLQQIELTPDDYPMMLKAFMVSDIKDWQVRKEQLNKILSEDLEVIVVLRDNLGAEYFDKKEFTQKLIVPTPSIRKMKIIAIEKDLNQRIKFIRLTQE